MASARIDNLLIDNVSCHPDAEELRDGDILYNFTNTHLNTYSVRSRCIEANKCEDSRLSILDVSKNVNLKMAIDSSASPQEEIQYCPLQKVVGKTFGQK